MASSLSVMANIRLYTALVIATLWIVQGLILLIIAAIVLYCTSSPPQDDLNTDQDLPPAAPKSRRQSSQPPAAAPGLTRPPLRRRNCFVLGPNGLTSQPLPCDWAPDSPCAPDAEGYETAPEDTSPARTMAEKRTLAYFEERLRHHQGSVSSRASPDPALLQTALTNAQMKGHSEADSSTDDKEEEEEEQASMIRRRNIRMREEGARVTVTYSQLAYPVKPAPAPRPGQPAALSTTPPPSPPSSDPPSSPSLSGLQSPTPCCDADVTGTTTPDHPHHQQAPSEVLLDRAHEKLLAIPADAVSRRLLRDGRAVLHRRKMLPRGVSFVGGGGGSGPRAARAAAAAAAASAVAPPEGGLTGSGPEMWYPSDMME